jgi:DNA-binding transcriptional LysR family regulator
MRDFNLLDTHAFKAFWIAGKTLNFTEAAKQAAMTQSGISQHISRLEKQLGAPLFLRVNKKIFLTEAGLKLQAYIEKYLEDAYALKESISRSNETPAGSVSYAMPESCLMSPHFRLLLRERSKSFPQLKLKVDICPSEEVLAKILNGKIDFGFVTKIIDTAGIKFIPFCFEDYAIVASKKFEDGLTNAEQLRNFSFVSHPDAGTYFFHWLNHHFPKSRKIFWSSMDVVGEMGNLKGAIDMAEGGVGIAVVPRHCIVEALEKGKLHEIRGVKKTPANNQIYIASVDKTSSPRRVEVVTNAFLSMV